MNGNERTYGIPMIQCEDGSLTENDLEASDTILNAKFPDSPETDWATLMTNLSADPSDDWELQSMKSRRY